MSPQMPRASTGGAHSLGHQRTAASSIDQQQYIHQMRGQQDEASATCTCTGPRIGRYPVSPALFDLWMACVGQHSGLKASPLSMRFKTRVLTAQQFLQFLADRLRIFETMERLLLEHSRRMGDGSEVSTRSVCSRFAHLDIDYRMRVVLWCALLGLTCAGL